MTKSIALAALLITLAGVAAARPMHSDDQDRPEYVHHHRHHHIVAPEITAAEAGGALTLLLGALVVLRGRKKAR